MKTLKGIKEACSETKNLKNGRGFGFLHFNLKDGTVRYEGTWDIRAESSVFGGAENTKNYKKIKIYNYCSMQDIKNYYEFLLSRERDYDVWLFGKEFR